MFHKLVNILKIVENKKNEPELRKAIWSVYSSPSRKEYAKRRMKVVKQWYKKEPMAVRSFYLSDERLTTKYDFRIEIHKLIHTNNPIERYFREIRRRTKAIGIFESIQSADRLLFLKIESNNN